MIGERAIATEKLSKEKKLKYSGDKQEFIEFIRQVSVKVDAIKQF